MSDDGSRSYSLFCQYSDDVRHEVTGKQIIIGMYQGGMTVPSQPPTTLPQLFILAHLLAPSSAPAVKSVSLLVEFAGKKLVEIESPPEALIQAQNALAGDEAAEGLIMQFMLGLQPFSIESEGKLSVKALVNRQFEVKGNALTVRYAAVAASAPAAPVSIS